MTSTRLSTRVYNQLLVSSHWLDFSLTIERVSGLLREDALRSESDLIATVEYHEGSGQVWLRINQQLAAYR